MGTTSSVRQTFLYPAVFTHTNQRDHSSDKLARFKLTVVFKLSRSLAKNPLNLKVVRTVNHLNVNPIVFAVKKIIKLIKKKKIANLSTL